MQYLREQTLPIIGDHRRPRVLPRRCAARPRHARHEGDRWRRRGKRPWARSGALSCHGWQNVTSSGGFEACGRPRKQRRTKWWMAVRS